MKRVSAALVALLLAACGAPGVSARAPLTLSVRQVPLVSGYLRLPKPAAQRRLLTTDPSALVADAIISLVDAQGRTRATGLVEPDGHFTLMRSSDGYDPESADNEGQLFTLEAINRNGVGDGDGDWISLRTCGYRQNGAWKSLSGDGDVVISAQTSVLTDVMNNDAHITFAMARTMLTPAGELTALTGTPYDATYDGNFLQRQLGLLNTAYASGRDPSGPRIFTPPPGVTTIEFRNADDFIPYQDYDEIAATLDIWDDQSGAPITEIPLPRLKHAGVLGLQIHDCPSLTSLAGLGNLRNATSLEIRGCDALTSLAGLEKLSEVPGELSLQGNSALTDLSALDPRPGRPRIEIHLNFRLSDCPVATLPGIAAATAALNQLPNLTSLQGLELLAGQGQSGLTIDNCDALTSLAGVVIPAAIGDLRVQRCARLQSLQGLEPLRIWKQFGQGGFGFSISYNPVLTDVSALSHLASIQNSYSWSASLDINDNELLCQSAVDALNLSWLANGVSPDDYTLNSGNNNGCL